MATQTATLQLKAGVVSNPEITFGPLSAEIWLTDDRFVCVFPPIVCMSLFTCNQILILK